MRLARIVEGQLEGQVQARWRNHEVGRSPWWKKDRSQAYPLYLADFEHFFLHLRLMLFKAVLT